jgi:hypothetical protein
MTELSVEQAPSALFTVTLKGDCGVLEVDASKFSDEVYKAIFTEGLNAIVNKVGMSKIMPGITKLEGEDRVKRTAEVREVAEKTVQAMYAGSIKGATKAKKSSGAVETEALRLAKNMAKDVIRANGQKVGAYSAKEITAFAKVVLDRNRGSLIAAAEKNLAERAGAAESLKMPGLEEIFGAKASSEEVKAKPRVPPKRKAEGEGKTLSAAQAGKVAPRAKPKQNPAHH